MSFFHGSKNGDIKELTTSHSKDGLVYVTSDRLVALCYASRSFPNLFSTKNGKETFIEIKPDLFKLMTKGKKVYIYTLENRDFVPVKQSTKCGHQNCFYSTENVKVIKKEEIPNAYEEFLKYQKNGEFNLIKYEDIDEKSKKLITEELENIVEAMSNEEKNDKNQFWYMFVKK